MNRMTTNASEIARMYRTTPSFEPALASVGDLMIGFGILGPSLNVTL